MGISVSSPTMIGNPFDPTNKLNQDGFGKFSNAMQAGLGMGSISSQPKKPSWQDAAGYFGNRLMDLGGVGGRKGAAQRRAGEIFSQGNFGGRSEQVGDGMYMYTPDRMGPLVIGGGAAPEERSTGQRIAGAAGGALSGAATGSAFGVPGAIVGGAIGGLGGLFG